MKKSLITVSTSVITERLHLFITINVKKLKQCQIHYSSHVTDGRLMYIWKQSQVV
jgi:folate-binding Fe-S cluster repair protein YgfZ